jgi:glycosyltransferase involved in cell wall biosynthesis
MEMKALFLTGSLVHGGAERHSITLVNRLAERGHECHAVYVKNDPSQLARLHGAASVRCLHARRYLDFASLREFCFLIKELDPAVIVAANPYALMYAWIALRAARVRAPLVVTFHTTAPRSAKDWLKLLYYRPLFWSADCAVFVCEAQRRYWRRRGLWARRNEVIYNGVDTEQWEPLPANARAAIRRMLGFSETDFVIGMSAVLRPEKNPLQLVDALARLRHRGIPARALFIGDGEMRPALEARARAAGVAGELLIAGFQNDVRPLVSACDAMALCSTSIETFSLAALESMALGRPVVHAALGGAAEMIRPGHDGWLFPVGDTGALVARLAGLADRGVRARMGANARETAEARFSERAMVDRYESTLQELALKRSRRETLRRSATAH